jgi:hypothetical protein
MSTTSPSGNGSGDHPDGAPHEPLPRPHSGRGLAIVIVAVVIGVLLLPSATRAPLAAGAKTTATTTTVASAGRAATHGHHAGTSTSTSTSTTVPPASIHVLVANATTTNGVAGAVTRYLASKGFATLTATNALLKVTASQIYTVGGATADAGSVAGALSLPATSIEPAAAAAPVATTAGANVVVIVGPDLATRFAPGTAATTAPA